MPLRDLTGGPGSLFHSRLANCTAAIEAAMREYGCFIATGHDLEFGWHSALDAAHSVFQLPLPALEEVAMSRTNVFGRGYIERGKEAGVQSTYFEHKEGYSYGHPHPPKVPTNLMEQRNIWPDGLSGDYPTPSPPSLLSIPITYPNHTYMARRTVRDFVDPSHLTH